MTTKVVAQKTSTGIDVTIQLPGMEPRIYTFKDLGELVRKGEQWYTLAHTMPEPEQAVNYLEIGRAHV